MLKSFYFVKEYFVLNLFYLDLFYNQRQLTESFLDQRGMINANLKADDISKTYN